MQSKIIAAEKCLRKSESNAMLKLISQRGGGGVEPEGVRKHLLSKKVFLCSEKFFRKKKSF